MINGVDVSKYQSHSELVAAINAGAQFVIVKATEGTYLVDPMHDSHVATARAMHVPLVGHYHFARHVAQAQAEVEYFLSHANVQPGDLVALDEEAQDGDWPQRLDYVLAFLSYLHQHLGVMPDLYLNDYYLSGLHSAASPAQRALLDSYPLWYATAGKPAGQPGISVWAIHQYSTAGGIDHDVLAPNTTLGEPDMPLTVADGQTIAPAIANEVWTYFSHDGKNLAGVLETIYDKVTAAQPVDVNALATALAPLVHETVDVNALATALAPLVSPQVLAALAAHPLVPKP